MLVREIRMPMLKVVRKHTPPTVRRLARFARTWPFVGRGYRFDYKAGETIPGPTADPPANRLREFFNSRLEGAGIWKWHHYFDAYDRHLSRFRGTDVHVLEIGVYSGGSLELWRDYFGPKARIYGVDIEEACRAYDGHAGARIFIGNQGDRSFWREFRSKVPQLDIVLDDGSHDYNQQILTMQELLPHLRYGGVYLCEDVHSEFHPFVSYLHGLTDQLNEYQYREGCTPFQSEIGSMHFYPFLAVVEKNRKPIRRFIAERRGTEWQKFWWEK
jgi:hypothetical protein